MAPTPELAEGSGFYSRLSSSGDSLISGLPDAGKYLQLARESGADDIFDDDDVFNKSPSLSSEHSVSMSSFSESVLSLHDKLHTNGASLKHRIARKWGWIVTLCNFVFFFTTWGFLNCYGLLFVHLQDEFRSSALETGWVGCMANAISYLASPLTNQLILRLRSTRLVVFLGVICCSSSLIISSFVPAIHYLYGTIGILYGVGLSFTCQACVVLMLQYYPGRNSVRCTSLANTGGTTGMLVLSILLNWSMSTVGWRITLRLAGAVYFVVCSLFCLPLLPAPKYEDAPNKDGSALSNDADIPKNKESNDENEKEEVKTLQVVSTDGGNFQSKVAVMKKDDDTLSTSSSVNSLKSFIRLKVTWLAAFAFFFSALAQTFHTINFVSHLDAIGISASQGALMITALATGEMIGKLSLSVFGVKFPFDKLYLLTACSIATALTTIPVAMVTSVPIIMGLSAGLGFVRSGIHVLTLTAGVEIFGVSRIYGATATVMVSNGAGFLLGAVVMGYIYDQTGSYNLSIIVATALFLLSGVLFVSIPLRDKWKRTRKLKNMQTEFNRLQQAVPFLQPADHAAKNVPPKRTIVIIEDIVSVV